jgi:hypothetical protein
MESTSLTTVSIENAADVIKEVQDAFWDIPFDNSAFQTENFVIASQITPERAYRAIGLSLNKKLVALQEALINEEKTKVELEELQEKIDSPDYDRFEKRRFELKIQSIKINEPFGKKLINDAIVDLNVLYKHFKSLPRYTRQQFEAGEKRHFLESLNRQSLGVSGAKESLINMFDDAHALENFESNFKLIANNYNNELLQDLNEKTLINTHITKENNKNA